MKNYMEYLCRRILVVFWLVLLPPNCKTFVRQPNTSGFSMVDAVNDDSIVKLNTCAKPKDPVIDVFFINLDQSVERRMTMLHQLQYFNLISPKLAETARIPAIMPKHFMIPDLVSVPFQCKRLSEASIKSLTSTIKAKPPKENQNVELSKHRSLSSSKNISYIKEGRNDNSTVKKKGKDLTDYLDRDFSEAYMIVTEHCGRPRNSKREMAVTLSHLRAIKAACDNTQNANTKYALILEDDIEFPYDIDFEALIASAPAGWGSLQLITTNLYDIKSLWEQYKSKGSIWTLRSYHDFWCAAAYIINKEVYKPVIDGIIKDVGNGWQGIAMIAGYEKPVCTPMYCCAADKRSFIANSPCIRSGRGYQSDHYIFALSEGRSYTTHLPLVSGARTGNKSTLHQDHVSLHVEAFNRINNHVEEVRSGKVQIKDIVANPKCKYDRNTLIAQQLKQ